MKRVLLTEEVRKQIVDEITEGVIRSLRKEFLKEYFAISRKHFILNSYHLLSPLMEHWCLIRFVRLTETDCGTIPHWKHEVSIFMRDIAYQNLDGGNKYKTRFKALKEAWNMGDFDKDPNAVYRSVISKFEDEQVDINNPAIIQSCRDFINDTPTIIELIAQGNYEDMKKYIQSL